jgi:hypothetical protein
LLIPFLTTISPLPLEFLIRLVHPSFLATQLGGNFHYPLMSYVHRRQFPYLFFFCLLVSVILLRKKITNFFSIKSLKIVIEINLGISHWFLFAWVMEKGSNFKNWILHKNGKVGLWFLIKGWLRKYIWPKIWSGL